MSQHVKTSPFKARRAVSTRNLFWVLANFCAAIFLFKKIACIQKISECQDVYDILITSKYFIFWWHKNLWFLLCSKMPFFLSIVKDVQISPFYALTIKGETHIFWGIICVSHYKNILDIKKSMRHHGLKAVVWLALDFWMLKKRPRHKWHGFLSSFLTSEKSPRQTPSFKMEWAIFQEIFLIYRILKKQNIYCTIHEQILC